MTALPSQNALRDAGVEGWTGRILALKVGKVVAVRRDSLSVDVAFMDGMVARNVPVLSGMLGTNYGFANVTGPTYDREEPVRKTHPTPQAAQAVVYSPGDPAHTYRDAYVACLQFEGSRHGQAGLLAVGYLPPQVCELTFPGGDNAFTDLVLFRTGGDVQITIDRNGKLSIQHPSGARLTMGEHEMDAVELEGEDFDHHYRLRNNLGKKVGFHIEDTEGTWVTWDHEGNLKAFAPKNIEAEAGIDITAKAGRDVTVDAGRDIKADAARHGVVEIGQNLTATVGQNLFALVGQMITATAGTSITLSSPVINLMATTINLMAPTVLTPKFDLAKPGGGKVLEI